MVDKKAILAKTMAAAKVKRTVVDDLKDNIKDLTAAHTHIMLSPKDKRAVKMLMGTNNLSEAIRACIREAESSRR